MKTLAVILLFILSAISFGQNLNWAHGVGNNQLEIPKSMATDANGNIFITGAFKGSVDFDPGPNTFIKSSYSNSYDVFVLKLASNGDFIDTWTFGGTDGDYGNDIQVDGDGNVIIVGSYSGSCNFNPNVPNGAVHSSNGYTDGFMVKLSNSGGYIFSRSIGGPAFDEITAVDVGLNNQIVLAGTFQNYLEYFNVSANITLNAIGADDIFVGVFTVNNNTEWVKRIGGNTGNLAMDIRFTGTDILLCGQSSGVVTSSFQGANTVALDTLNGYEGIFMKMDNDGTDIFFYNLSSTIKSVFNKMALDANGNIYLCGNSQGDTDFDFSSADYILPTNSNSLDPFITKYSDDGELKWAKNFGSTSLDNIADIAIDGNKVFTTGHYLQSCNFHTGLGNLTYTANGSSDLFLHVLDTAGNFITATSIGGTLVDQGVALKAKNGKLYCSGIFQDSVDFDPGVNNLILASSLPSQDMFIFSATYNFGNVGLAFEETAFEKALVFPNPSSGTLKISGLQADKSYEVQIINLFGQVVEENHIQNLTNYTFSLTEKGIYFLRLMNENQQEISQKIIIQ